ncbi:hypothetical protein ACNQPY_12955 [Mycobacteroides abscessus]|uniref:hypothetical protein n=1 Tax=Mycobacteroides abscessus TaxID=36809 RepID=UPI003AACF79F
MSYPSEAFSDYMERHGESLTDAAIQAAAEELVISTLENIPNLTNDERENVRHEVWEVLDAAIENCDILEYFDGVEIPDAVHADIDAAVAKVLAFTREPALT